MDKDTKATFYNTENGKVVVTLSTLKTSEVGTTYASGGGGNPKLFSKEHKEVKWNLSNDIKTTNTTGDIREILIDPLIRISNLVEMHGKDIKFDHITYDESVNENYDYQIIRSQGHDGLLYVTDQTVNKALLPLINKTTYCSATIDKDEVSSVKEIKYIIGDIRLESEFGIIETRAGKIRGMTDTVYIPVRCEYIF